MPRQPRVPKSDKHAKALEVMRLHPELRAFAAKPRLWTIHKLYDHLHANKWYWVASEAQWRDFRQVSPPVATNGKRPAEPAPVSRRVLMRVTASYENIDNIVYLLKEAVELIDYKVIEISRAYGNEPDNTNYRVYLVMEPMNRE